MEQPTLLKTPIADADVMAVAQFAHNAQHVAVLCHANPDGDALGSLSAMTLALRSMGLHATPVCKDAIPPTFAFLPLMDQVVHDPAQVAYDAVVFLDCGAHYMTGLHETHPRLFSDDVASLNIDHHPSNDRWADINIVITDAASTTQILFALFQRLKAKMSPGIATALLTGLYTDTGAFMHQNTTPDVYAAAAELVRAGANITQISDEVFSQQKFAKLKLWGDVLRNVHVSDDGGAIVGVHKNDYLRYGCERTDLAGVVDYLSAMPEAEYCVMLTEDEKGNVKASLRTRKDHVDVQALAKLYGGGGHVKASGFTIKSGKLKKEVKWKIVTED